MCAKAPTRSKDLTPVEGRLCILSVWGQHLLSLPSSETGVKQLYHSSCASALEAQVFINTMFSLPPIQQHTY